MIYAKCAFCGKDVARREQSKDVKRHFCDLSCKSDFQKLARPVSREWLEKKYVEEKLDCADIGKLVHRDPKSVWGWLKDFGIKTRPRGQSLSPEKIAKRKTRWTGVPKKVRLKKGPFVLTQEYRERMSRIQKERWKDPLLRKMVSDLAKASGRVPYDPKIGSYMKGRKGADTPNWKGGITPERQKFYASAEWMKAYRVVRKRDKGICQRCGLQRRDNPGVSFDIHHLVSFAFEPLRSDPENLVYLCEPCHYWVHGKRNVKREFIREIP